MITWFIPVITPQTICCFSVFLLHFIGISTSKSSALSSNTLLLFETQLIDGALFLSAALLLLFALSGTAAVIVHFTTIYASLKSHKSALNIGALILILC